jgi:hypothetical protein
MFGKAGSNAARCTSDDNVPSDDAPQKIAGRESKP